MRGTNKPIGRLAEETEELAADLLPRLDLLAGADGHEGISYSRYKILSAIHKHGPISMGNLGEILGSAPSTISELVSQLATAGLVAKATNPRDGRSVVAELTSRGQKLAQRFRARVHEDCEALLRRMSPAERDTCLRALNRVVALLRKGTD